LEAIYSDADVVTGVEVTYTVNFSIYGINGTKDTVQSALHPKDADTRQLRPYYFPSKNKDKN